MNKTGLEEIQRICSRTQPRPAESAIELAMKWAYKDAAEIAKGLGHVAAESAILERLKFKQEP